MLWKFLRRKMEQMLLLQAKAGVTDPGLFRRGLQLQFLWRIPTAAAS